MWSKGCILGATGRNPSHTENDSSDVVAHRSKTDLSVLSRARSEFESWQPGRFQYSKSDRYWLRRSFSLLKRQQAWDCSVMTHPSLRRQFPRNHNWVIHAYNLFFLEYDISPSYNAYGSMNTLFVGGRRTKVENTHVLLCDIIQYCNDR